MIILFYISSCFAVFLIYFNSDNNDKILIPFNNSSLFNYIYNFLRHAKALKLTLIYWSFSNREIVLHIYLIKIGSKVKYKLLFFVNENNNSGSINGNGSNLLIDIINAFINEWL